MPIDRSRQRPHERFSTDGDRLPLFLAAVVGFVIMAINLYAWDETVPIDAIVTRAGIAFMVAYILIFTAQRMVLMYTADDLETAKETARKARRTDSVHAAETDGDEMPAGTEPIPGETE